LCEHKKGEGYIVLKNKPITGDGKVKISLNLDPSLLKIIDEDKKQKGMRRSDWIIVACQYYLLKGKKETEN
jgi:metal-responsive CopG/Arc/MetJ family transcriptional regulator